MKTPKPSGFTLIEVIAVILLLGILGVAALPRFTSISQDAQISTNIGLATALQASINAAHLQWQVIGSPGRLQNLPGFSDGILDMSTTGWPIGIDKGNGNDNIGRQDLGCSSLWNYLLQNAPQSSLLETSDYQSFRHTGNRLCSFIQRDQGDTAVITEADRSDAEIGVLYNSNTGTTRVCGQFVQSNC